MKAQFKRTQLRW